MLFQLLYSTIAVFSFFFFTAIYTEIRFNGQLFWENCYYFVQKTSKKISEIV